MGRASGLEPLGLGLGSRAEEALYRRNAGRVFGFCLSRLGRRDEAEDAVQTTFLQAMQSLRRGVVPLVESAWLIGIARNVCLQRFEAADRLRRLESTCNPQELDRASAARDERPEELIGLDDALALLPEQQRRAILLRDWRGLSYAEVAQQLGVSHSAVETLIFRGRRTLAELLREEPKQTRRRLASLGNLGSIFTALKTAFTGAATATKVAAAVTVVAVSGTGLAAAPSLGGGRDEQPRRIAPVQTRVPATPASRPAAPARHVPVARASALALTSRERARRAIPGVPAVPQVPAPSAGEPVNPAQPRVAAQPATAEIAPAAPAATPPPKPQAVMKSAEAVLPPVPAPVTLVPLPDVLVPSVPSVPPVPPVPPVTPPVIGTIVDTAPPLPVDPPAVAPPLPVAVPPVPPLLP